MFAQCRWFSPRTPASSTTKTGCHNIAEILLRVAFKHPKNKKDFNIDTECCIFYGTSLFIFRFNIRAVFVLWFWRHWLYMPIWWNYKWYFRLETKNSNYIYIFNYAFFVILVRKYLPFCSIKCIYVACFDVRYDFHKIKKVVRFIFTSSCL